MALLQTISVSRFPTILPSVVSSFNKTPRHVSPTQCEISLFSGATNLVGAAVDKGFFTPSTRPRKILCAPPQGKHIREDYLVKKFSAQELHDLVKGGRDVPIIIDFYATWCGPCILMAQELEMLAVEYEKNAMIVKVDTDDEYEFARDMQVRGLPTLFFISPDPTKDAIRTEGLIPIQMMRDIIDNDM